jgi:hypothetical protein
MEYPGSTLTKHRRHIILAVFFAAFLIITPLLIVYTVGYRYDWQSGIIKEIGAISIDVVPTDALVFLNNEQVTAKIPVRLKNIAPNSYHIRISRDGYYDWNKDVVVKSKQTVYIKDITLIKKSTPQNIVSGPVTLLSASSDGTYLIYRDDATQKLILRNTKTKQTTTLALALPTNSTISWSKNNTFVSVASSATPTTILAVFKTTNPGKIWNITKDEPAPITKYLWDPENDHTLYYSTANSLFSANALLDETTLLTPNSYLDWYFSAGQLWTLQSNTSTNQISIERDTLGFLNTFNILDTPLLTELGTTTLKLQLIQNNTVLTATPDASAMILTNSERSFVLHTSTFVTSPSGWWLLSNPSELWSSLGGGDPYLLNRSGTPLRQAVFIDTYNTVALRSDNKISVLYPYYLVNQDILEADTITGLGADSDQRILYFSGKINGQEGLWEMNY